MHICDERYHRYTVHHLVYGFLTLDIRREHVIENGQLPLLHRDPFDRLIIAQAIVERMVVVSNDLVFDDYPVRRIF